MTAISSLKQTALDQAEQFAYSILGKSKSSHSSDVVHHHHHHYHDHFWWGPSRTYYYSDCPAPTARAPGGKKDNTVAIVAFAALVVLTTSYYVGADMAMHSKASHQKDDIQEKKFCLLESGELHGSSLGTVFEIEEQMADSIRSEAQTGLLTKAALIASAIAAGTGALLAAPAIVTAGFAAGATTAGVMLMRAGYIDSDTALKEQALQLLDVVEVARQA